MTNEEFDRELQWCADWHPGKPEEIEYTVESDLDSANQPPPNGKPSTSNQRPEEEAVESEECETGEGMECGTCCSEYVVVRFSVMICATNFISSDSVRPP